jgi:Glycosyltransferases involved in cell wall biogenesis
MALRNLDKIGVSVVICCYNGAKRILHCLEHLSKQRNIDFSWEILLIDNNSTDNTAKIANDYWNSLYSEVPLIIIHEPRPGTMYARRTGIESANYRYLLYCDDDNWLNEDYVKTAFDIITSNGEIAVVGGHGILELESKENIPAWLDKFKYSYGAGPQGKVDGDTTHDKGCLYTAGAMLDRVWLNKLFEFDFTSSLKGRDGKSLVAGEDTELTYALKIIGGKLYYSSKMHFRHFMPVTRIQWSYLQRLHESFGYSDILLSPYTDFIYKGKMLPVSRVIINTLRIFKNRYEVAKKTSFAEGSLEVLNVCRSRGAIKALARNMRIYTANKSMVTLLLNKCKAEQA